ncbi:hypothetical protein [Parasediminibacterium sp. JCM 36343]|uniref:hypothetical protein n=1 Tax=Parasediminibacterium sp. JCM 36343 TaxID=3374279 RepID=UPI00397B494F
MMNVLELKVYDIFKSRFSEQEAAMVIEYFETKAKEKTEEKTEIFKNLQTKDLENLRKEINTVFATKEDSYKLKSDLLEKIETSKTDIIKWMFAFWVGTIGIAIVFYLLRK